MGAVKQLYTASKQTDPDTGAVLYPYPKHAQKDYERGREWRSGRIVGPAKKSTPLMDRLRSARGMLARGRAGHVRPNGSFVIETTKAFRARMKGERSGGWYTGGITLDEGGRLIGGNCNCPDEGAELREVDGEPLIVCKHMMWATLKTHRGEVKYE